MASSRRERSISIPGLLVVGASSLGAALYGFAWGGPMVALLGALGGALLGFAAYLSVRAVIVHRSLEESVAPQVLQLPPEQALSVLSAMINREGAAPALASDVLSALAAIRERAAEDLETAIVEAEELAKQYPRSPAVPAELARLYSQRDTQQAAAAAASEAIALAVTGGMNSVAARVYADFVTLRDAFELSPPQWHALSRVLSAREDEEAAAWCTERAQADATEEKARSEDPGA